MSDAPRQFGPETQGGVYLRGLSGATPEIPTNFSGLETAARKKMTPEAWAYTAGGAGLEIGADANRAAFNRFPIAQRVLGGAGVRNLGCEIFGARVAAPVFSSPIGVLEMMHPDGRSRCRPRDERAQPADDHFVPGFNADGKDRRSQRRWSALLPTLLRQV